jgi:hypothetical protein
MLLRCIYACAMYVIFSSFFLLELDEYNYILPVGLLVSLFPIFLTSLSLSFPFFLSATPGAA